MRSTFYFSCTGLGSAGERSRQVSFDANHHTSISPAKFHLQYFTVHSSSDGRGIQIRSTNYGGHHAGQGHMGQTFSTSKFLHEIQVFTNFFFAFKIFSYDF